MRRSDFGESPSPEVAGPSPVPAAPADGATYRMSVDARFRTRSEVEVARQSALDAIAEFRMEWDRPSPSFVLDEEVPRTPTPERTPLTRYNIQRLQAYFEHDSSNRDRLRIGPAEVRLSLFRNVLSNCVDFHVVRCECHIGPYGYGRIIPQEGLVESFTEGLTIGDLRAAYSRMARELSKAFVPSSEVIANAIRLD